MLQALLAERFQLKLHRETRESSVYALTTVKSGHKLKPADSETPEFRFTKGGLDCARRQRAGAGSCALRNERSSRVR
jgi:uncharacterized protein (TIGR03435 family)